MPKARVRARNRDRPGAPGGCLRALFNWALPAAMVLVGITAAYWWTTGEFLFAPARAQIVSQQGRVHVVRSDPTTRHRTHLLVGDTVRTEAGARVEIAAPHGRVVALGQTRLVLEAIGDRATRWSLREGVLLASADAKSRPEIRIDTPLGPVHSVGTVFQVRATPDRVDVDVAQGSVIVEDGDKLRVGSGQRLTLERTRGRARRVRGELSPTGRGQIERTFASTAGGKP